MTAMRLILCLMFSLVLSACMGGPSPADRSGVTPSLVLEEFLDGQTYAYGVFERGGVLDRKFWVEIDGDWDGDVLTLDEHFLYDDGTTQRRVWEMDRLSEGRFSGTAGDVIGSAEIETYGDAAYFEYLVDLLLSDSSTVRVRFNDRIYRLSEDMLMNRATVSKFGLDVGEVSLVFIKDRPSDWPDIPREN